MPMTRWLNIFLRLDRYTDRLERDRARFVLLMLALLTVVYAVYVTLVNDRVAPDGQRVTLLTQINHYPVQIVLLVLPFALVSVGWWLVRSGRLALAVWVPLLMLYIVIPGSVFIDATSTFEYNPASATLALFIVMGGVLARYNGILVTLIAACVSLLLDRGNMTLTTTVNLLLLYGLLAAVTSVFIQFNASSRAMGMRVADDERQKLSELVSQVTRKAASRVPLAALLDLTVELIVQKYPQFYHAQIFLVDETGVHARLHASTGPTGKILLARSHALVVGSFSVIGQVTQRGEPLVDVAGTAGSMHR
ncbi:MAG: hypothetical protein MUE40_16360, partial [Anaerolineae bacterium]|nr:hypothetical protein [Anaerolineae bacterium]